MRKLALSKETLRILDDDDLARVAGGGGKDGHEHNGKTGQHGSCNGNEHKKHDKTGQHGSCNANSGSAG
jgi:hypothetical protein